LVSVIRWQTKIRCFVAWFEHWLSYGDAELCGLVAGIRSPKKERSSYISPNNRFRTSLTS
jgi:hypothetical protein